MDTTGNYRQQHAVAVGNVAKPPANPWRYRQGVPLIKGDFLAAVVIDAEFKFALQHKESFEGFVVCMQSGPLTWRADGNVHRQAGRTIDGGNAAKRVLRLLQQNRHDLARQENIARRQRHDWVVL